MRKTLALLVLLAVSPTLAEEEDASFHRDPAAVAKVDAAEKLVYLPRREGLTKLKVVVKLVLTGKHALFDRTLGALEVWLEEPEFLRVTRHGSGDKGAEEVLPHHDGKRCVRRDLVEFAAWPYALYPDADLKNIEFAPKSRTRIRILDRRGTGVEVTFDRNGLPKQHTHYVKGKRQKFERLEFAEHEGAWLLVRRTAQGGRDETKWHWQKREGLWLPKSIDRTFGKLEFRIDLDYRTVELRPEGTPPKLPPRSDPAAVAALKRAERLVYDPVALGVESARFRVTVSKREWKGDQVFRVSFAAPKTAEVVAVEISGDLADKKDQIASMRRFVLTCLVEAVYYRPPVIVSFDDRLVTKKPGEERTYLVSDRKATEIEVLLDRNGAFASCTSRNLVLGTIDMRVSYRPAEGTSLIEESRQPWRKSSQRWTWQKVDGFWLPKRVVFTAADTIMAMTASDYEITKKQQEAD